MNNNNLTLNQARQVIEDNNGRPVSKSTILNWLRQGLLPSTRFGKMYVIDAEDAESFVISESVRRKGNPGYPRPKCERFAPGQGRCLKTARWIASLDGAGAETVLRCDEHKQELMSNAETGKFEVVAVERLPRQEK